MHDAGEPVAAEQIGVLLVEDDEGDARLVADELAERLPLAAIERTRTLEEALAALDTEPDCVLLDLGLPDALGLDAVARLQARDASVPLIVLTGLDDEQAGAAAVEAGAQDYLVKGHVDGEQLARSINYAISRRRAEDAGRELMLAAAQAREVARLERGLAPPPLLEDASVWVASVYRAGRSRALLGGDFFDVVQTPGGGVNVVVGDVCGNGPDEAAIGVSMRAAWRALALAGQDPGVVLDTLRQMFDHERHLAGLFATLCTLAIEPRGRTAEVIRAGHPRPVLVEPGSVSALSDAPSGPAVGIEGRPWTVERVQLPPEWTLLLYTDGIIEGRTGDGSQRLGEEGLHELIGELVAERANWRERPRALLDDLIAAAERLNGGALNDDVAMLLLGTRDGERS
jgi:serine phosphatase RsbU (regulator of sigma subunit)